jgi:putative ribosome biogenesis GTPase RsgA
LATRIHHDPERKWTSRNSALSDLASEGWIIDGPHGKQPTIGHNADQHFYGYGLRRTIH